MCIWLKYWEEILQSLLMRRRLEELGRYLISIWLISLRNIWMAPQASVWVMKLKCVIKALRGYEAKPLLFRNILSLGNMTPNSCSYSIEELSSHYSNMQRLGILYRHFMKYKGHELNRQTCKQQNDRIPRQRWRVQTGHQYGFPCSLSDEHQDFRVQTWGRYVNIVDGAKHFKEVQ